MSDSVTIESTISEAPYPFNVDAGKHLCATLAKHSAFKGIEKQEKALHKLLFGMGSCSPYLARLAEFEADWLAHAVTLSPKKAFGSALDELETKKHVSTAELSLLLRQCKRRVALMLAICDLGGIWNLEQITGALSQFADKAMATALHHLLSTEPVADFVPDSANSERPEIGSRLFLLGMGKLGANELNYSSDIDLIALYDDEGLEDSSAEQLSRRYVRVIRKLISLLSEPTGDGYVFRTDFRLRPDPGATPICMSCQAAESYYAYMGRSWERAAYIKARICAGDFAAGQAFLHRISPFIWRKYLDFHSQEDADDIIERIRKHTGSIEIKIAGHDLKLGPGGIRDIEFFAQTRQLISGGRDPSLRIPQTIKALAAINAAGWIDDSALRSLSCAYDFLRKVEHRLQMVEDAQTHKMPVDEEARKRIAFFSGYQSLTAFEADIELHLQKVSEITQTLFQKNKRATSVERKFRPDEESHLETNAYLQSLGYENPESVSRSLLGWMNGRLPATRTARAQQQLINIAPLLLERFARAASPDEAFNHFGRFLAGLPVGVQFFALLESHPELLQLIGKLCSTAPVMAEYLGQNSGILDAMLDRDFLEPISSLSDLMEEANARFAHSSGYEERLDEARLWVKEKQYAVSSRTILGITPPAQIGPAFSSIAEAAIRRLAPAIIEEFSKAHGPQPGGGLAIVALGKLGSCEMTAKSDIDTIFVYDVDNEHQSSGDRPLPATQYYARLSQKLISAISVPTRRGVMYEVDMRLRPSGKSGPLAVSLSGFSQYQAQKAWLWEHMALTRARVIFADSRLGDQINNVICTEMQRHREPQQVLQEAGEMREKIFASFPETNIWSIKHVRGGLVDIEFITQSLMLIHGAGDNGGHGIISAIEQISAMQLMPMDDIDILRRAAEMQMALMQLSRITLAKDIDPNRAGDDLKSLLLEITGETSFDDLSSHLMQSQNQVQKIYNGIFS